MNRVYIKNWNDLICYFPVVETDENWKGPDIRNALQLRSVLNIIVWNDGPMKHIFVRTKEGGEIDAQFTWVKSNGNSHWYEYNGTVG